MSPPFVQEYVSIGGNRNTSASCWSRQSNLLAFGADQDIAIWDPSSDDSRGITHLLHGHKDKVTAVTFLSNNNDGVVEQLLTGSADGRILAWTYDSAHKTWRSHFQGVAHKGAVNCIANLSNTDYFATGGADAKIKLWRIGGNEVHEILTIVSTPRLIPLTLVLGLLPQLSSHDGMFLAAGGTRNNIHVYALKSLLQAPTAFHQATLRGHEGWIRSLSLQVVNQQELILASASHDKYVRLWKFQHGSAKSYQSISNSNKITSFEETLTAKVQTVSIDESHYAITFEALLLGHEDWIYSAAWNPNTGTQQLLTASADGTLTIWEPDPTSGIWISAFKLGEISGQKGATTATGSSGGFWTGLWSPDGQAVTCLGRTGSWRLWQFDAEQRYWTPKYGVSGHLSAANGLTWSPSGDYLLSTSSDQTTRLHAEWKRSQKRTWHEFSRPQIHGYDLNCISCIGNHQFASGADEKLLRVFNEPRDVAKMLQNLCDVRESKDAELSVTAAIPVLGLSNKAIVDGEDIPTEADGRKDPEYIAPDANISLANLEEPPTEDLLSRHTLWPEHEKLYGHGYEISESAYSASVLATACKASSTDHAVIRLYDTKDWNEIKPPLVSHSLTVTRLSWSCAPDNYLLSVGRDRQWTVFKLDDSSSKWRQTQVNPRAHTRMILDAAWSPVGNKPFFATAGRDKVVKLWHSEWHVCDSDPKFDEHSTIKCQSPVTALSFTCNLHEDRAALAVGEESGALSVHFFNIDQRLSLLESIELDRTICPSKAVTRLAWRNDYSKHKPQDSGVHLAVAATDGSVRILAMDMALLG